jgi:hypothetical protein
MTNASTPRPTAAGSTSIVVRRITPRSLQQLPIKIVHVLPQTQDQIWLYRLFTISRPSIHSLAAGQSAGALALLAWSRPDDCRADWLS